MLHLVAAVGIDPEVFFPGKVLSKTFPISENRDTAGAFCPFRSCQSDWAEWMDQVTGCNDPTVEVKIVVLVDDLSPALAAWATSVVTLACYGHDQMVNSFYEGVEAAGALGEVRTYPEPRRWTFVVYGTVEGRFQRLLGDLEE